MMQFFGHIFVALLVTSFIVFGDYFLPGSFLKGFIENSFIETFATLIGLNIASVVFLLGQLMVIEGHLSKGAIFNKTRSEIKQNSYFMLFAFAVSVVILSLRPDLNEVNQGLVINKWYYLGNGVVIMLFYLSMVSIFQILKSIFVIGKNVTDIE